MIQSQEIYSFRYTETIKLLKKGIWIYFILLIFEGALRKWFSPGLATPLLIVRDPIAIWLIFKTWKKGLLPSNLFLASTTILGFLSIITAIILGHGNFAVALFGARIMLIHFPIIFVIGSIFNFDDVVKIGKAMLWISVLMVIIIGLQFYSPQSAWINRGIGGEEGSGFSGAMGYFRPSGTFSFTNGNSLFFSFLAVFVFYFWLEIKRVNKVLLIAASIALLFSIPLSISRTLLFHVILTLIFAVVASSSKPEYFGKIIVVIMGCVLLIGLLLQTSSFGTATEAFTSRYEVANKTEGGLEGVFLDRFLGGLIGALTGSVELPFFGYGMGMGTNVGSMLLSGERKFMLAEGEWGRVIGELGQLFGILIVLLRIIFTFKLTFASYRNMVKGNLLPWMLMGFGFLILSQGGWAQPTSLGFFVIIGGFVIASLKTSNLMSNETIEIYPK